MSDPTESQWEASE